MKNVKIGNNYVGDDYPVFITFEAGPTHSGVESAMRLIDATADSGANAIKFQILDPERLVSDKQQMFEYEVLINRETGETEKISEPLYDLLERRSLNKEQWIELKKYADHRNLAFFATIGFEEEIDLVEEIGCHSIKIASADVNHIPLIRKAAKTGLCIQLDTGNSSIGEVEVAVDTILSEDNHNIIIHQCPSGYPARLESINLRIINTLKSMFNLPVAYSDHTPGWEMDVAAVAIGANLVEKTITEDRMTRSVEHVMSIEPSEMNNFVKVIRDLEIAMGTPRRIMHEEEILKRNMIRRSLYLLEDVEENQRLGDVAIEFRRPGDGINPDHYEKILDAKFNKNLIAGTKLKLSDLMM